MKKKQAAKAEHPADATYRHPDKTRLTSLQAEALVSEWIIPYLDGDESISEFLLLLRTLAYQEDATERENIYIALEGLLMPYTFAATGALDRLLVRRHAALGEAQL